MPRATGREPTRQPCRQPILDQHWRNDGASRKQHRARRSLKRQPWSRSLVEVSDTNLSARTGCPAWSKSVGPLAQEARPVTARGRGPRPSARPQAGGLLRCGLRLRQLPRAVQELGAGTVEPECVVPALRDRQAIRDLAVAAAELDVDRAVSALLAGDAVDRIGVVFVLLEEALVVIDADRPERVDGDVLDPELVDRLAVVLGRGHRAGRMRPCRGCRPSRLPCRSGA